MNNNDTREPIDPKIERRPVWALAVGATFAGLSMTYLMGFTLISGFNPRFYCDAFGPFAYTFAFSFGLSAAFMSGEAVARGTLGSRLSGFSIAFGLGGGVAASLIAFIVAQQFPPENCGNRLEISNFAWLEERFVSPAEAGQGFVVTDVSRKMNPAYRFATMEDVAIPFSFMIRNFDFRSDGTTDLQLEFFVQGSTVEARPRPILIGSVNDVLHGRNLRRVGLERYQEVLGPVPFGHLPVLAILGCFEVQQENNIADEYVFVIEVTDRRTGQRAIHSDRLALTMDAPSVAAACG